MIILKCLYIPSLVLLCRNVFAICNFIIAFKLIDILNDLSLEYWFKRESRSGKGYGLTVSWSRLLWRLVECDRNHGNNFERSSQLTTVCNWTNLLSFLVLETYAADVVCLGLRLLIKVKASNQMQSVIENRVHWKCQYSFTIRGCDLNR